MTQDSSAPDGERRAIELEIDVAGTPDEVFSAIATSAGVSGWMQPTQIEPRPGGDYTFDLLDGTGPNATGSVVAYEAPDRFATGGVQWAAPGADIPAALSTEWTVQALDGSTCVVRIVMSGFGRGDAWDNEIEGMTAGMRRSLEKLRDYLSDGDRQRR